MEVRGALAPVWGRVSKVVSKKEPFDSEKLFYLEVFFELFVTF